MSKMRAMVILSGCGHKDGTEVNEAVLSLMVLEKHGIGWTGFAPDELVATLSHSKDKRVEVGERNPLEEASRITRGNTLGLSHLEPDSFDLLVMPGGLGAANVLSDFGSKGFHGAVREELKKAIVSFHKNKKPIVAICISPAVVALALKEAQNLTITLGEDLTYQKENPKILFKSARADECVVDPLNRIISTPAFMIENANRYSIFVGIDQAIAAAIKMR
jgi:enhancing lycopene biosynthesis protein 2